MSSSSSHDVPNHIVLYDVPWNAYVAMIDALGERRLPHVYQQGTLEMMSPLEDHELIARFLGRIVQWSSVELGVPIRSVGSATRQHHKLEHGFEPDESYYIGANAAASRKRTGAAAKHGVPDLAIEIEWSKALLKKLDSYAVVGVKEVWRYNKGKVEFHLLADDGAYESIDCSFAFPPIAAKVVTRFVARLAKSDENTLVLKFVEHLRSLKKS